MSQKVTSRDRTVIAYDEAGSGPAVILIDGALSARGGSLNEPLTAELSPTLHGDHLRPPRAR